MLNWRLFVLSISYLKLFNLSLIINFFIWAFRRLLSLGACGGWAFRYSLEVLLEQFFALKNREKPDRKTGGYFHFSGGTKARRTPLESPLEGPLDNPSR